MGRVGSDDFINGAILRSYSTEKSEKVTKLPLYGVYALTWREGYVDICLKLIIVYLFLRGNMTVKTYKKFFLPVSPVAGGQITITHKLIWENACRDVFKNGGTAVILP